MLKPVSEEAHSSEPRIRDSERTRILLSALEVEVRELSAKKFPWTWFISAGLSLLLALATATFSILNQIQTNNTDVKVLSQLIEGFKSSHNEKISRLESDNRKLEARVEKLENKPGK
jgi:hypothetical protein